MPYTELEALARVGSSVVLQSDVAPLVAKIIEANKAQAQLKDLAPAEADMVRKMLTRQAVEHLVAAKLPYEEARRTVPGEQFDKIKGEIGDHFDKKVLPVLMKKSGFESRQQLEESLTAKGTTLEREKRQFVEQALGETWKKQQIKIDETISYEESRAWYKAHETEYQHQARARWEELVVWKGKNASEPEIAAGRRKLAELGNQVLRGAGFADVACAGSEGPTASTGGLRDWTTRGSLVSRIVDEALFNLPVGELSQILEDERGLYIIRVLERTEAGQTSFEDAQAGIKEKIKEERRKQAETEYLAKLRKQVPVWTIYDEAPTVAEVLPGTSR